MKAIFASFFSFISVCVFSQTMIVDSTFNIGTGFSNGLRGTVSSISIQRDEKIIVGGNFVSFNGDSINQIARLNLDGSLDTTFNPGDGIAQNPLNEILHSTSIQTDGKIIVGGWFTSFDGTPRNHIARLNTDGSLDTAFNTGMGFDFAVISTTLQTDGKIIVGGRFSSYNGTARSRIARLNTDGSLDTTFNIGSGFNYRVYSIVTQTDGKIIVGGEFTSFNGTPRNYIARLNTDGSLDTTFNVGTGFNLSVNSISPQTDGKIIVGGWFSSFNGTSRSRIARLNIDGSLDTTFTPPSFSNAVESIHPLVNGKIIVGGRFKTIGGIVRHRIAQLYQNGLLDTTFTIGAGFNHNVLSIAIQTDSNIIAGGSFTFFNGISSNRIVRLQDSTNIAVGLPKREHSEGELELSVYPNPAKNTINIIGLKNVEASSFELYDNIGRLLKIVRLEETSQTIDISSLESGFYVYRIIDKNGSVGSGKLLVE